RHGQPGARAVVRPGPGPPAAVALPGLLPARPRALARRRRVLDQRHGGRRPPGGPGPVDAALAGLADRPRRRGRGRVPRPRGAVRARRRPPRLARPPRAALVVTDRPTLPSPPPARA